MTCASRFYKQKPKKEAFQLILNKAVYQEVMMIWKVKVLFGLDCHVYESGQRERKTD